MPVGARLQDLADRQRRRQVDVGLALQLDFSEPDETSDTPRQIGKVAHHEAGTHMTERDLVDQLPVGHVQQDQCRLVVEHVDRIEWHIAPPGRRQHEGITLECEIARPVLDRELAFPFIAQRTTVGRRKLGL